MKRLLVILCLWVARAGAQQIEVPVLVLESPEAETGEVDTELTTFVDALNEAKKVFEDTDDLANYSATKFAEKFPNFTGDHT